MDRDSSSTSPWEYMDLDQQTRRGDSREYPGLVRSLTGEAQVLLREIVKREKRCTEEATGAMTVR